MPLVDYGSSDESESDENNKSEEEEDENKIKKNGETKTNASLPPQVVKASNNNSSSQTLFSSLPTPKSTFSIPDNTFKLLSKKQPVRIILPSLSEIDDSSEEKDIKKPKPSQKGSGLFALLPAPKNSKALVPDSVKNKNKPTNVAPKPFLPKQIKNSVPALMARNNKKSIKERDEEDDENDDAFQPESFFFTSTDDVVPDPIEPFDIPSKPSSSISNTSNDQVLNRQENVSTQPSTDVMYEPMDVQSSENNRFDQADLDAEALEKLVGAGARKRKGGIPDEIIDINVDSMVGDAYMNLSKDLTKEQEHRSYKKSRNVSTNERRKHQITYLASQAKEKELELRNQWANNRMTRQQTQSKYGF